MGQLVNGIEVKQSSSIHKYAGEFFNGKRGWQDLEGIENTPATGTTAPTRGLYQTKELQ